MSQRQVYSVSEFVGKARRLVESDFGLIWLEGEISNFSAPSSGHWYFSLKDQQAQIKAALFRNRNQHLSYRPKDGDKVLIRARPSIYEPRGDFQLIGEYLEPAGFGALQQQFELLKQKLAEEGLFDEQRKKPLPEFVTTLGVITSATGAALHDVLAVLKKRAPYIHIIIYPSAVQGAEAAPSLIQAITLANQRKECDALLLTRGGGSLEDLWSFNDERLARCIVQSDLPIVAAVGHEVDFTIAEFVADKRAATPSAGAALLSMDQAALTDQVHYLQQRQAIALRSTLKQRQQHLKQLQHRLVSPEQVLHRHQQRLDELHLRLTQRIENLVAAKRERLSARRTQLNAHSPRQRLLVAQQQLQHMRTALRRNVQSAVQTRRVALSQNLKQLHQISPLATLSRGYTLTKIPSTGKLLRHGDELTINTSIETLTNTHVVESRVTHIRERE